MEINKFDGEITGVMPVADIVEGRFGVLTSHTFSHDFGSQTDLPGFKVPATAEEAKNAGQIITWAVDNTTFPQWKPIPSYSWALRGGFDQAAQSPFTATMYVTNPANQNGITIPSGTPALAFGKGVYTLVSGTYIYDAGLKVPGALVQVANTAEDSTDAGKIKILSAMSDRKVGTVREFDTSTNKLTVEID